MLYSCVVDWTQVKCSCTRGIPVYFSLEVPYRKLEQTTQHLLSVAAMVTSYCISLDFDYIWKNEYDVYVTTLYDYVCGLQWANSLQ